MVMFMVSQWVSNGEKWDDMGMYPLVMVHFAIEHGHL